MPKNCQKIRKSFVTRVIYNSKFKTVNTDEANTNFRKNVHYSGKNTCVQRETNGQVTNMQKPVKQKCHIVQDLCYNVPVNNRFDKLDNETYSPINTCDKAVVNVVSNVAKQVHGKYKKDLSGVLNTQNTVIQSRNNSKGELCQVDSCNNSSKPNNCLVKQTVNRCSKNVQIKPNADVEFTELKRVDEGNTTYVASRTEPNLSCDMPWEVVDQECTSFPHIVPLWHCKLAKQVKLQQAATVPVFQTWKHQNKFAFGFIPLSPLLGNKNWEENGKVHSPIEAYNVVKSSGFYNFQQTRLLVDNQLNPTAWEAHLTDYWDWQLVQYIKFGFPLDVKLEANLSCDLSNHKSATLFPSHVDSYLQEEKCFKAIFGPFSEKPFKTLHCSPFIARVKTRL